MECESEPVTVGKSCKFKCLEGYVRTGSENRTCLERPKSRTELPPHWPGILTKWSGTPTQCLPKLNSTIRGHQPNYNYYDSYRMNGQNASTDFDENPCSNYGCEHWCIRKLGKPECGCRGGFILDQKDKRSCIGKKSTRTQERREKEDKSFSEISLQDFVPGNSYESHDGSEALCAFSESPLHVKQHNHTSRNFVDANNTQHCSYPTNACFILWQEEPKNNITIFAQGCWDGYDPNCKKNECIAVKRATTKSRKTSFCCCIGNFCNVNTTDGNLMDITDTSPDPVERSVCEELPTPVNGKMECITDPVKVGKSCKFTCLEGYIRTGSEFRICLEGPKDSLHATKWSGTPTLCLPNSAVRSRQPSHNYYDTRRMNRQKTSADFDKSPKSSVGRFPRHQDAKREVLTFDKFDGPCKNLNCTQLCVKENGQVRCGCGHGYILNKEDRRSCDRNTGPPIHSKVHPCSLNNGGCDHTCQLTKNGKVRCKCNTGYILAEDRKRCLLSRTSVLRVTCGVSNGGCEHTCSEIGNSVQCSCLPGYRLQDDGKRCKEISCPAFSKTLNSVITCENGNQRLNEMDRYPFGAVCEVTCDIGFIRIEDKNIIKCQEDGTWNGRLGDCKRPCTKCEDLPIKCDYTGGSHHCSCMRGFEWDVSSRRCIDIDECVKDNGGCVDQKCINTRGSYRCLNICRSGYKWDVPSKKCIDIDECRNEFLNSCDHICNNTEGSYSCLCEPGYVLIENRKCQGCRKGAYWSPEDHGCVDCPANSFTLSEGMTLVSDCVCRPGFTGSPKHNVPCEDIDECAKNNFGCSHQCVNVPGSAFCSCPVGYTTDNDNKTCIDINECSLKNGGCEGLCHNTEGSFRCSCPSGFRTSNKDIYTCEDVDECLEKNGGCQHHCINFRGGYHCSCRKGFRLDRSMKNCTDISCPGLPTPHFSNIKCNNGKKLFKSEMDSYPFGTVCKVVCNFGFKTSDSSYIQCQEDGTWNGKLPDCRSQSCPPLQVPEHGDVHPPSCSTVGNTVKQTCTFTCRQGYRLKGLAVFNCKNDLTWRQSIADIPVCEPEEIRASIECIRDVSVTLQPGKSSQNVTIPEPVTNMESYEITPKNITVGKPMEFPAGKTNVLFSTSSPSSNRTAKCLTTVNVIDEEPPEFISCPNDILIENAKVDGEIVTWKEPMVIDNVGVEFLKSSVEPNSILKPGSYHVEYIARDGAGNTKSCLFKIDIVRLNCGNLTDPVHGIANCMDWLYGNLCQPECDEGYMRYPSDPSFYSCGDSGVWEPSSVISDCLPYKDAILSTCPDGSELITIDETEEEICLECPPLTPWSPTTRKCEENTR